MSFADVLTFGANRAAAGAQEVELELKKREEAAAARDRAVIRERRINALMGSQAALAAAKGTELAGSVGNISIVDAKRATEESLVDDVNTAGRISALNRQKKSVRRLANIRGAVTIVRGLERNLRRTGNLI